MALAFYGFNDAVVVRWATVRKQLAYPFGRRMLVAAWPLPTEGFPAEDALSHKVGATFAWMRYGEARSAALHFPDGLEIPSVHRCGSNRSRRRRTGQRR
jgi:hypothetical protein